MTTTAEPIGDAESEPESLTVLTFSYTAREARATPACEAISRGGADNPLALSCAIPFSDGSKTTYYTPRGTVSQVKSVMDLRRYDLALYTNFSITDFAGNISSLSAVVQFAAVVATPVVVGMTRGAAAPAMGATIAIAGGVSSSGESVAQLTGRLVTNNKCAIKQSVASIGLNAVTMGAGKSYIAGLSGVTDLPQLKKSTVNYATVLLATNVFGLVAGKC